MKQLPGNLILTIKKNEQFQIGENIFITLLGHRRVAIECPREIKIQKIRKDNCDDSDLDDDDE